MVLNLTWVTHPPIRDLDQDQVAQAVKVLRRNLDGWDPVAEPGTPAADDIDVRDWQTPKRTQQKRWNDRLTSTAMMFDPSIASFSGHRNFGYFIDGQPIGVLALHLFSAPQLPYVGDLLTHPGSAMAGGILIERAVQISDEEWNRGGVLALFALDDDAREAYKCLGFAGKSGPADHDMTLDPTKRADIWQKLDNTWRLTRHHGLKYAS